MDAETGAAPTMVGSADDEARAGAVIALDAQTVALIETLLETHDVGDIKGRLWQSHNAHVTHEQSYEIYARIAVSKLGRKRPSDFRPPMDPPVGFAEAAATKFNADLIDLYRASVGTISRWRRETGAVNTTPIRGGRGREPAPEDFAKRFAGRSVRSVQAELGLSSQKTTRWFREAGLSIAPQHGTVPSARSAPKANRTNGFKVTAVSRPVADSSRAGMAADHLRRFGAVWRCTAAGGPSPKGDRWRRGSAVLTDEELIERAMRKGWQPDAWKTVRPTTTEGARA